MLLLRNNPRCLVVIPLLACSVLLSAKSKDKQNNSDAKFTSRTEMVLIPALVTDKFDAHVTGLKKEDFTVFENGVAQNIASFEEVSSRAQGWSYPINPKEFTNALAAGAAPPRITVIVLDFINTPVLDQMTARKALLKYLAQSVDERESTAVYTLTRTGIHLIHDFTTDPRILAAALHSVNGDTSDRIDVEPASFTGNTRVDPGAVKCETDKFQAMIGSTERNFRAFERRLAITNTLEALQQIAQALAGFPGRKSLVWASGGFPFSVSDNPMQLAPAGRDSLADFLPMYERTWQLLNNAQVALYPIDVRGLQPLTVPAPSVSNAGTYFARNSVVKHLDTEATFLAFAEMTGGRAYLDNNDLVKGFWEAVQDSAEYYLLGYYLNRTNAKPGWRKLAVKVKRDHVQVRARSGFFVTNEPAGRQAGRNDIEIALLSPLDYTSLGLVLRWTGIEPGRLPGKKQVKYRLHVAADPALIDDADNNHLALQVISLTETPEGKAVDAPVAQKVNGHLSAEHVSDVRHVGIDYSSILDLPPGEYMVRFVVHDDLTKRIGSITAPLKVE